ncbi:MAG: LptF/LptG family permease [Flavobacteriaceae bacterium]|nr:LptF/LptG family permease [Flavobacteriaceae bacterium]
MKILNKYILKNFLAPFLATFLIILFVLIMQALWLQFDKIAGKGIDIVIIFKFLGYIALMMAPTALPIAILLSSIMALGNLAENYEFAAIKSAGISLQRLIRPLVLLMIVLSGLNFLFLNYIFPYASLKSKNLIYNMKMKEPGLALVAGTFNTEIPGYSIKFKEKYGPENNFLKDVLIYEIKSNSVNNKVITAEKGEIVSEEGSRYLTLVLENGFYNEEIINKKSTRKQREKVPAIKAHFDRYKINIDVSSIGNFDPDDLKYKSGKEMLSLNQLLYYVDSLDEPFHKFVENRALRMNKILRGNKLVKDTIEKYNIKTDVLANFNDDDKSLIINNATTFVSSNLDNISSFKETLINKQKIINAYDTEFHKRLAFSVACLVLFFIGTPLGSIIRKGGFGLPMIMAIIIFVIYFFISTLGKNMAESNTISPFFGGWLASIVLLPFGVFLMIRATNDKGIFNVDAFIQPISNFFNKIFKIDNNKS